MIKLTKRKDRIGIEVFGLAVVAILSKYVKNSWVFRVDTGRAHNRFIGAGHKKGRTLYIGRNTRGGKYSDYFVRPFSVGYTRNANHVPYPSHY